MNDHTGKPCIPPAMLPLEGVTEITDPKTGSKVLLVNGVMFTGYQQAQGSLSERFFIPLRDQTVIMGAKCPKCGQIICPPYQLMCPDCNFTEMEPIALPDRGVMMAPPPITMYANAFFKGHAPFARGYVLLGEAQTGLNVWCKTTTGMIRPGIFEKGTRVKVVFNDVREGLITDICVVPESELTEDQIRRSPLLASEVNWKSIKVPTYDPTAEARTNLGTLTAMVPGMKTQIDGSPRAKANLGDWKVTAEITSAAGHFYLHIGDGEVVFTENLGDEPNFHLAVADPQVFIDWWNGGNALTNLLVEGTMWMSDPLGLETIFKLDRLPRSIRRDREETAATA